MSNYMNCELCGMRKGFYACDICGKHTCNDCYVDLQFEHSHLISEITKPLTSVHVRSICHECLSISELKYIDDIPQEDLPLIIGAPFVTKRAKEYLKERLTSGTRSGSVFDFAMEKLRKLVAQVKEDLQNGQE